MARHNSIGYRKKAVLAARLVGASALGGVLVAGIALPAVGAAGLGAQSAVEDFDSLPDDFRTPPLSQATTVYDADGGTIATVYSRDRTVIGSDAMSPLVKTALVDIEDSRYYQHGAVDLKGVLRAVNSNAASGTTAQGASTLTQQYVKNVFVDQAGDDVQKVQEAQRQTLDRKVRELKYAIKVEETLTKDQILANYLNITFFGEKAYGIETAAQRYFSVHAKDLTLPQAALLAGLVQSPSAYDPIVNQAAAKTRRDTVLRRMAELGHITAVQAAQAIASPVELKVTRPHQGCITAGTGEGFFCDYVQRVVLSDPAFGKTPEERKALWKRGGLQIRTTLDPKAQKAVQQAVTAHAAPSDRPAAVMTVVQPGTGKVLAMAQSRPYGLGKDQTTINLNVPKRVGGGLGFPTGSTFKPIVAAAALENGIPASRTYTSGYSMPWPAMRDCSGGRFPESGEVHNDSRSLVGSFAMPAAMKQSVNTYFANLEAETGLCEVAKTAARLGITQQAGGEKLSVVPSMTLGSNDLTPLEMASVYAAFAAHGTYCAPTAITSVTGPDGKALGVPKASCTGAMSRTTADTVTAMLRGVVEDGGTGATAGLSDRATAGKTGTTNEGRQVWFVGYTPELAAATVVSDTTDPAPLEGQRMGGERIDAAFGGAVAGPIWRQAVEDALDGVPAGEFTAVRLPSADPEPSDPDGQATETGRPTPGGGQPATGRPTQGGRPTRGGDQTSPGPGRPSPGPGTGRPSHGTVVPIPGTGTAQPSQGAGQ
ncbi:transglycosylase domain-containing protein [Streptomyces sp. NRRL B-24484]|uniref:transglycosylase domain-containing protein n=1 Tax=Streptomyces sp. NRRL B-24484 TaxID=1463833 RepID=UPI0006949E66|nr:transglycosylase domain-containing protein [Streptomyces sp. NRRL B-24484]